MVGGAAMFITTSSVLAVQPPLLIVHLKVTLVPTTIPVTPLVDKVGVVTVAVPLITVQAPVPVVGVLPANVAVVVLHKF